MAVGHIDVTVYKSTDFSLELEFTDSDGDPQSLTGATITAKIRKTPSSVSTSAVFGVNVTDAGNGKVTISLTDTVTAGLDTGRHYWDIISDKDDKKEKLLTGRMTVMDAVSR